jgi:hypothetical protein
VDCRNSAGGLYRRPTPNTALARSPEKAHPF